MVMSNFFKNNIVLRIIHFVQKKGHGNNNNFIIRVISIISTSKILYITIRKDNGDCELIG
jgi:hypothetical protein